MMDRALLRSKLGDPGLEAWSKAYFRGQLQYNTGVDLTALESGGASAEDIKDFLYRSYAYCTQNFAPGSLNTSARGAEHLKCQLAEFEGVADLRRLEAWLGEKAIVAPKSLPDGTKWSPAQRVAYALAADTEFAGMQLKMASLWIKVLCRDVGFFTDHEKDPRLWVPVDRVNVRMLRYLLGQDAEIEKRLPAIEAGMEAGASPAQQAQGHDALTQVGTYVMGGAGPPICLEYLWFIGHFYHENMRKGNKALPARPDGLVYDACKVRGALRAAGYAYSAGIPDTCPLSPECKYDPGRYQEALNRPDSG
jgi:hypothetical protein